MKKLVLTTTFLVLAAGVSASHAETTRDWAISGYVGLASYEDDTRPDPFFPELSHDIEHDNALKAGVTASKYYNDFSFDLGIAYLDEVTVTGDDKDELGTHSHIPVHVAVNYHFNTDIVSPYIGVGIGYSFHDASTSDFIKNQGVSVDEDDGSMFYLFTIGLERAINDNYSVFIEGSYRDMEIEATGTFDFADISQEIEEDFNSYECALGVKYFF